MSTDERSKRRAKLVCAMPYKEEEDECQPILKSSFGFFLIFLFQLKSLPQKKMFPPLITSNGNLDASFKK